MGEYVVRYIKTEKTIVEVLVDADTPQEAVRLVEEYEVDEHEEFIDSIECFHTNACVIEDD